MLFDQYQFKIPVGFSTAAQGARAFGASGIIGHKGFFDKFSVTFNYSEKYFELKKKSLFGLF